MEGIDDESITSAAACARALRGDSGGLRGCLGESRRWQPNSTHRHRLADHGRGSAVGRAVELNSFYGYPPAINRTTGVRGQFVTDPTCIYDAQTQRFFLVVLTLEVNPANGAFTHVNHLDLAVSATSNPTGTWNIYR